MDFQENFALSRPSLIKLEEKQIKTPANNSRNTIVFGHALHQGCSIITDSEHASANRIQAPGIDLSFRLRSFKAGRTQAIEMIGRLWHMHYPATFKFTGGNTTSQYCLELAPAYAGFKNGIVDRAALASLAAVSQSFNNRAQTETLPGDARASISRLLATPVDATRLCCRIAVLYTAAAVAETLGQGLRLSNISDEVSPRTIATFSDWATSLEAATKRGEQPVYIGTRSLDEPEIYSRVARILALNSPKFTTGDLEAPPTVVQMWPEIPGARAYIFAPTDTYGSLTGTVTARDIALYAEYFSRLYGLQDEMADWIQYAMGFATRPAGSGALGTHSAVTMSLPRSALQALVLSPVSQASDTIGSELPSRAMLFPQQTLVAGAMRAATYLASLNITLQAAGGYWLQQGLPTHSKLAHHYNEMVEPGPDGSAAANATLHMAAELGWAGGFAQPWMRITPRGHPNYCLHPVEVEEALPFTTALPATSALLAIIKPVALDAMTSPGTLLTPTAVKGRQSLTDAHYGMLGLENPGQMKNIAFNRVNNLFTFKDAKIRQSYRGQPSDGQFAGHRTELVDHTVGFTLPTLDAVAEAFMAHEKSKGVEWFYEWNIPHSTVSVYAQYVQDAYVPTPLPPTSPVPTAEPMIEVPTTTSQKAGKQPNQEQRKALTELRDVLGADFGSMLDAHSGMASLAGKQLPKATYEANSRTLTGLLTAFEVSMVPYLMESPSELKVFLNWFAIACDDAREWDYRPTSKDQLIQQKALAATLDEATPSDPAADEPPAEPKQQAINLLAAQEPFTISQPDPGEEVAAATRAATGEYVTAGSTLEDFQPTATGSTQTSAAAVAADLIPPRAQPISFTAPPPA